MALAVQEWRSVPCLAIAAHMCVSGGERLKRWPHEGPANAQAAILVKPKRPDRPSSRLEVLFHGEQKFPDQVASAANSQFIMVASQLDHGGRLQQALFGDWSKACEVVFAELRAKTGFWRHLPWRLYAVCTALHGEEEEGGRVHARGICRVFDSEAVDPVRAFGRNHRVTRRFLHAQARRGRLAQL